MEIGVETWMDRGRWEGGMETGREGGGVGMEIVLVFLS